MAEPLASGDGSGTSDYHLSEHFMASEFWCKCGCGKLIYNDRLINSLEILRELAHAPITILSGTRCPKYNRLVGGVIGSQHLAGSAADISIPGLTIDQIAELAERVPAFHDGGIGKYPQINFVHVDVRTGGPARWVE